jgi:hypothetical protein
MTTNGFADLSLVFSEEPEPAFERRHYLLHQSSDAEIRNNVFESLEFLSREDAPEGMNLNDFLSLKNDVADRIINADIEALGLFSQLVATIQNEEASLVWRDYCIQKIPILIGHADIPEQEAENTVVLLTGICGNRDSDLMGTALIALREIAKRPGKSIMVSEAEVMEFALASAQDESLSLKNRLAGLQIAAEMKQPKVGEYAVQILNTAYPAPPVLLKVSALAALGQVGDPSHLVYIEPYRLSPDVRLRAAARTSFNLLSKK